mmetsp:Transcript_1842/g.2653  ORF Transcript_1842/g.2653 Transcript_1842/m.2653 type:complete len:408 (-) Transcript_1842:216-1439(-)
METTPEQATEGMVVVRVLAAVLERLITTNSHVSSGLDSSQITKFHALKAPAIGIHQYLERIHKYASCSSECFILALIYIDRLIQKNNFVLTGLNVHRVVITAVLLAAKFFDDAYYNNAYYAKVGGVLVSEMNGLEVEFLFRINFSLHVTPAVFSKYQAELVSHAIGAGLEEPRIRMPMSSPNLVPSQSNTWKVSQEPIIVPNQDGKTVGLVKNLHTSIAEERHAKQISPSPPPSNNPVCSSSSISTHTRNNETSNIHPQLHHFITPNMGASPKSAPGDILVHHDHSRSQRDLPRHNSYPIDHKSNRTIYSGTTNCSQEQSIKSYFPPQGYNNQTTHTDHLLQEQDHIHLIRHSNNQLIDSHLQHHIPGNDINTGECLQWSHQSEQNIFGGCNTFGAKQSNLIDHIPG